MFALAILLCASSPLSTFHEQLELTHNPEVSVRRAFGWGWARSPERNTIVALLAGSDADFRHTLSAIAHAALKPPAEPDAWDCALPKSPRLALPDGAIDDGPRNWQLACMLEAARAPRDFLPENRMNLYVVSYRLKLTSSDGVVRESLDGTQIVEGISPENALKAFTVRSSPRLVQAIVDHMLDEAEARLIKADDAKRTPIDL